MKLCVYSAVLLVSFGMILLVAGAVDYLLGYSLLPDGSAGIGIIFVAVGMFAARRAKKKSLRASQPKAVAVQK